jgi:hypothetical protein
MAIRLLPAVVTLMFGVALAGCRAGTSQGEQQGTASAGYEPVTIENCGIEQTFERPPERAVTMNQHVTEIMLALGLDRTLAESVSMEIVAEMLARPKVFHYFGLPFLGQLANLAEPRIAQALQEKQQGETSGETTKGWQELFSRLLDVSREQQEVFVLAYVEGQPDTEIATALGTVFKGY